ncbi:hypothetical protein FH965_00610 [Streptomyces spectabilis]|uniref:Condensation domain-containing protein n=1 Tax=Streptomyces spectabilis TaxID=68270 RepID=A0A516R0T1_STRST|nr:hypothetical protein FH965_00610 [Streptomyces spectabilis]
MVLLGSLGVSAAQEGFRRAREPAPDKPNNNGSRWLLDGAIDEEALIAAGRETYRAYTAARVNFRTVDGELRQVVREESADSWEPVVLDVSETDDPETAADALAAEHERQPFDPEHGELFRAGVIRLSDVRRVLFLSAHHVVGDDCTLLRLVPERVAACYRALVGGAPLPDARVGGPELLARTAVSLLRRYATASQRGVRRTRPSGGTTSAARPAPCACPAGAVRPHRPSSTTWRRCRARRSTPGGRPRAASGCPWQRS